MKNQLTMTLDQRFVNWLINSLTWGRRREELLRTLGRAVNTWEEPPHWVLDLYDRLRGIKK